MTVEKQVPTPGEDDSSLRAQLETELAALVRERLSMQHKMIKLMWFNISVVVSSFLLVTVVVLAFAMTPSYRLNDYQNNTPPKSLACSVEPPRVDLAAMHAEIRNLLYQDFKLKGYPLPCETDALCKSGGVILMNGGVLNVRYDTDVELQFRQESNFLYLTGYNYPDATVAIDLVTGDSALFVPDHPQEYAVWNGVVESKEQLRQQYGFTQVYYQTELLSVLGTLKNSTTAFTVYGMYDLAFVGMENFDVNREVLRPILYDRRTLKTDSELEIMRYASAVSAVAHVGVMNFTGRYGWNSVSPSSSASSSGSASSVVSTAVENQSGGQTLWEYNAAGQFVSGCFACGLQVQAYLPIVAASNHSAILHYNVNSGPMLPGSLLLIDAGAEYFGYGSDITRTYPVNGVFTALQKEVYNMVLAVQQAVINIVAPGTSWSALQSTNNRVLCEQLTLNQYVLDSVDNCVSKRLYYYFMPHGVSHYVGLDVHDRYYNRVNLEARNVITVEPGIYFNTPLFEPTWSDPKVGPYLNQAKIQPILNSQFGGVRIEDMVVVSPVGQPAEIISARVPRTVQQIEALMLANRVL